MSINTAERRRSAIDFGKGERGTGMPIPSGSIDEAERSHVLNDNTWSETGNRYLIKLFRDYIFHQVNENGSPRLKAISYFFILLIYRL